MRGLKRRTTNEDRGTSHKRKGGRGGPTTREREKGSLVRRRGGGRKEEESHQREKGWRRRRRGHQWRKGRPPTRERPPCGWFSSSLALLLPIPLGVSLSLLTAPVPPFLCRWSSLLDPSLLTFFFETFHTFDMCVLRNFTW